MQVTPHNWCQVTPFGNPGITARLTTPPGLSRPPTSFIGSWCQGIHTPALKHLTTPNPHSTHKHRFGKPTHQKDARIHYTTLNKQPVTNQTHTHRRTLICSQPDKTPHHHTHHTTVQQHSSRGDNQHQTHENKTPTGVSLERR